MNPKNKDSWRKLRNERIRDKIFGKLDTVRDTVLIRTLKLVSNVPSSVAVFSNN